MVFIRRALLPVAVVVLLLVALVAQPAMARRYPPHPNKPKPTTTVAPTTTTVASTTTTVAPTTTTAGGGNRSGLAWRSGVHTGSFETDYPPFEAWRGHLIDLNLQYTARDAGWPGLEHPWFFGRDFPGETILGTPFRPENVAGSLAACANGDYDSHWATFGQSLVAEGKPDMLVEYEWEFNNNYSTSQAPTWVACWKKVHAAVRSTNPQARFAWTINAHANDPTPFYPGDAYVDVVGIDTYDMWPANTSEAIWTQQINATGGLQWSYDFAQAHGKPFVIPEWGLSWAQSGSSWTTDVNHGGDNPFFIEHMQAWFRAHPDIYGELYFDAMGGTRSAIFNPGGQNPGGSAAYRAGLHN